MFERLLDLVLQFGEHLLPFKIIPVYQAAGVLRFGRYNRTVGPGVCWKWPFIEDIYAENTFITTVRLQPQTCTTKDRAQVVVSAVVKYRVVDVQPYLSNVGDQHDVLIDVTMGAVLEAVRDMTFEELVEQPPESRVASKVRRQVKEFGFEIMSVTFTDMGRMRSLRIVTHTPLMLDN